MNPQSVTKGTLYLTISSFIFLAVGYALNLWLGRVLGPADYGTYGVVISLMSVINILQTTGLPRALSKYLSEEKFSENALFSSTFKLQMILAFLITISVLILAEFFANLLNDSKLTGYIRLSALIYIPYGLYSLQTGYYNGLHFFKRQAILSNVYSFTKFAGVILLAYYFHLYGAITGFIIAPLITSLFVLRLPLKSSEQFSYKKLLILSLPLVGFAFFSTFQQSIDLYFVKAYLTSEELPGYYTANQNIARVPYFLLNSISLVLLPGISKSISQNNYERARRLIERSLRYALILLVPLTFLLSATSSQIISLMFSSRYLPGAPSLSILVFGFAFITILTILANILSGAGKPKESMIISIAGIIITAVLCYILIPIFSLTGAALATTIGAFLSMVIALFLVYKHFYTLLPAITFVRILGSSLIIYMIAKNFYTPALALPILYLLLFAAYFTILLFTKEIKKEEILALISRLPVINRYVKFK